MRKLEHLLAVLGVIALAAGVWQRQSASAARERAANLEAVRDSLVSAARVQDAAIAEAESALAAADSVAEEEINRERAKADSAKVRARKAETDLRDHLVGTGADEALALLETLMAEHSEVVKRLNNENVILRARIVERDSLLDQYRSVNETLWEAVESANALAAHWEKEANPPFGVKLWKGIPGLAVTGAGAYAGSAFGEEAGAAIGAAGGYLLTELFGLR